MAIAESVAHPQLIGEAPPSPAGPISVEELAGLPSPPLVPLPKTLSVVRFNQRQIEFVFGWRRKLGETFRMRGMLPGNPVITSHPDHVKSLFTAKPEDAPSITGESPLRPIVGPNSMLTANGARHMRQRKLLLPPFHGEAIERYAQMIAEVTEREIDRWPVGRPFALAPRMQAITLDVIMSGILGIEGRPPPRYRRVGPADRDQALIAASTMPGRASSAMLMNVGRDEPVGLIEDGMDILDRPPTR